MSTKKPSETEDEYFARLDAEKKRKAAVETRRDMASTEQQRLKELHFMCCPKCGHSLETVTFKGLAIDKCFNCNGTWLDEGELEQLAGRESGFLDRLIAAFKS